MKTLVCKEHQSKHAYPRKWKLTSSWFGLPHVSMIAKKLGADMKNINFITQQLLIRKPITINSLQVEGKSDAGTYKWYGGVNQSHFDVLSHLRCTILPRFIKTSSPKITLRFIFSKNFFSEGNFSGIRSCLTFTILHGSACSRCRNFVFFFEREIFHVDENRKKPSGFSLSYELRRCTQEFIVFIGDLTCSETNW